MSDAVPNLSCVRCGGANLCHGTIPAFTQRHLQFKPDGNWIITYPIRAYVCVACGALGLQVDDETVRELRAQTSASAEPGALPDRG